MPQKPAAHAELVAELRRLRGELSRAFDRIPFVCTTPDVPMIRQQAEKAEVELSEVIDLLGDDG